MLTVLKPAEIEVVSLVEVKAHLRLDHSFEDDYLLMVIQAATQSVETYLGKSLISRTWQLLWQPDKGGGEGMVWWKLNCRIPRLLKLFLFIKFFQETVNSL
jgi:hypothetical protein